MAIDTRIEMIAITMISSISVYPRRADLVDSFSMSLPLRIGSSIARPLHALGVDVEHILPGPAIRFGIVLRAALAPVVGPRHGIDGNAAQKLDLGARGV